MSVLCPTNFTPASLAAAEVAAGIAERMNQSLHLAHVAPSGIPSSIAETVRTGLEQALADEARRVGSKAAGRTFTALLSGDRGPVLEEYANTANADVIVAGGPRNPGKAIGLGGGLDSISHFARVPLLVVKNGAPFRSWFNGERPLRVVLGVERTDQFSATLDWLPVLAQSGPIELIAAHVVSAYEEALRRGLPLPTTYDELSAPLREALERDLRALLGTLPAGVRLSVKLEPGLGRTAEHLFEIAERERADLLMVGTHGRRALAKLMSVSHQALRVAPMSVLVVPGPLGAPTERALPVYRNVVAATDLSEGGKATLAHALALVQPGGTVHLVHVAPPSTSDVQRRDLEGKLKDSIPRSGKKPEKQVRLDIVTAPDAVQAILQAAERWNADVLCIGYRSASTLARVLPGSTAMKVLQASGRPTLLVHAR